MARYFFFFFFAAFFFAIVSPPSRSPRVHAVDHCPDNMGGPKTCQGQNTGYGGQGVVRPPYLGGRVGRAQAFSCADDGLRCSRRFTYSWFSGTPFLQSGQVSGA